MVAVDKVVVVILCFALVWFGGDAHSGEVQ